MAASLHVQHMLLACIVLAMLHGSMAAGQGVAYVSQDRAPGTISLLNALQDETASTIVIVSDYAIADELDAHAPINLTRSVKVTGRSGTDTFLDEGYKRAQILLSPTTTFTVENITLVNDRRGKGILSFWSINDIFLAPTPGAKVVYKDVYMLRLGCTTIKDTSQIVSITKRSEAFPGANGSAKQLFDIRNVTIRGELYTDAIHGIDYSIDAPLDPGELRPSGGYAMLVLNSSRVCKATVSAECLAVSTPDACVNALVEAGLAAEAAAAARRRAVRAVAIAVPTVAVVFMIGVLAALVWSCKRRRLLEAQKLTRPVSPTRSPDGCPFSAMEAGMLSNNDSFTDSTKSMLHKPFGLSKGWRVDSTLTTPFISPVEDPKIEFGELVGAGAFGRVYLGRWAGQHAVAIKVIQHTTETADAVRNEVELMLLFNHPNVVRAFHYATYIRESNSCPSLSCKSNAYITRSDWGTTATSTCSSGDGSGRSDRQPQQPQQQQLEATPVAALALPAGRAIQKAETWLVQEYCDVGTLGSVAAAWHPVQEGDEQMLQRLLLLQDCARGLQVLHDKKVVHGDLNARNVLVSSNPVAQYGMVAKLADLGLSRIVMQFKTHHSTNSMGTMSHMPPELLRHGAMSPAVDVYSFGVMMWELFTGQPAFRKLHYGQFFEAICLQNLRPLIPPNMPIDYKLLMERCWQTDPSDRPSCSRVLQSLRIMIDARQARLMEEAAAKTAAEAALEQQGRQRREAAAAVPAAAGMVSEVLSMQTNSAAAAAPAAAVGNAAAGGDHGTVDNDRSFRFNGLHAMGCEHVLTPTLPRLVQPVRPNSSSSSGGSNANADTQQQQQQRQRDAATKQAIVIGDASDGSMHSSTAEAPLLPVVGSAADCFTAEQQAAASAAAVTPLSPFAQVAENQQQSEEQLCTEQQQQQQQQGQLVEAASSNWGERGALPELPEAQLGNWFV